MRSFLKWTCSIRVLNDKHLHTSIGSNDGFTLVELMLVVGMVGLLASVSIPNYQRFVARARQSEAKIQLASAYSTEKAFFAEKGSYTYCLFKAGFEPNAASVRYYMVGYIHGGTFLVCGPDGARNCYTTDYNLTTPNCDCNSFVVWGGSTRNDCTFMHNASIQSSAWVSFGIGPYWTVDQNTFLCGAAGSISNSGFIDTWTIDQKKILKNSVSGI